ncbi:MAG: L,D-transpeptidase [Ktedonobacteraceae bacterium]
MRKAHSLHFTQIALAGAIIGVMLLVSACGGDSHLHQQASSAQTQLAQNIQQAKNNGVPDSQLQPIFQQEKQLQSTSAPFSAFDDTPDNTYYTHQSSQYQQLLSKLQDVVAIATSQAQGQAQQNLQGFQQVLNTQQAQKVGDLPAFSLRYTADTNLLATARTPKDYLAISNDAVSAISALGLLSTTYAQLVIFNNTITQMQQANLDVTAMQSEYTSDLNVFNSATTSDTFQKLGSLLDAQYQLTVVTSSSSLPYVGAAKLNEFQNNLSLLKTYGLDASPYQKSYDTDKTTMAQATTLNQYLSVSNKINGDIGLMHNDLVRGASWYLIKELDQEANAWGQTHLYHDTFDGKDYILDSGYTMNGVGYWLQRENSWSYRPADYQSVLNDDNNELFNFQMFQQDYADKTPGDQPHQTDLLMMQHYPSLQHGTVIMVSMAEEMLRFYVDGKLVNAFPITTGRVERPSLPGVWTTQDRKSPTEFKSDDPISSPFYYPPTPIHFAILYHWGGFFVHDSWWRNQYGMGTQFPHNDTSGNEFSAGNGSHGCVNVRLDQAGWLYAHTDFTTQIAMY